MSREMIYQWLGFALITSLSFFCFFNGEAQTFMIVASTIVMISSLLVQNDKKTINMSISTLILLGVSIYLNIFGQTYLPQIILLLFLVIIAYGNKDRAPLSLIGITFISLMAITTGILNFDVQSMTSLWTIWSVMLLGLLCSNKKVILPVLPIIPFVLLDLDKFDPNLIGSVTTWIALLWCLLECLEADRYRLACAAVFLGIWIEPDHLWLLLSLPLLIIPDQKYLSRRTIHSFAACLIFLAAISKSSSIMLTVILSLLLFAVLIQHHRNNKRVALC